MPIYILKLIIATVTFVQPNSFFVVAMYVLHSYSLTS